MDANSAPHWVISALEEHQHEAERWLAQHNAKLRSIFAQPCSRSADLSTAMSTTFQQSPPSSEDHPSCRLVDARAEIVGPRESYDKCGEAAVSRTPAMLSTGTTTRSTDAMSFTDIAKSVPPLILGKRSRGKRLSALRDIGERHARVMKEYASPNGKSAFVQAMTDSNESLSHYPPGSMRCYLDLQLQQGYLDVVVGLLILFNAVIMFVELEVDGSRASALLADREPGETLLFDVCKHTFNVLFSLELLLKLFVYRLQFWQSCFNTLDAVIVFATLLDAYVLSLLGNEIASVSVIRLVRFVRWVRVLRVIRTLGLFRQLRVLLSTIAMSFMSLVWSMVVLFLFMLTSSLLLCQSLQDYISDSTSDGETRAWVQHHYGTSSRALYTVFELTFSGCWPTYSRKLIDEVSPGYAVFFAFYVTGVIFAMVRIISALFLKDTLQAASNDADIIVGEKVKEMKSFVKKLSDLFKEGDTDNDGFLTLEELNKVLSYPKVKLWMGIVGLDVSDANTIFDILDDGDGKVSQEEFVNGIMRLKGYARSQDAVLLMRDNERIMRQCRAGRIACEATWLALQEQNLRDSAVPQPPPLKPAPPQLKPPPQRVPEPPQPPAPREPDSPTVLPSIHAREDGSA